MNYVALSAVLYFALLSSRLTELLVIDYLNRRRAQALAGALAKLAKQADEAAAPPEMN